MMPTLRSRSLLAGSVAAALALASAACTCLTCDDDPPGQGAAGAPWPDTVGTLQQRIIGLHATGDELYAFTANEFLRYSRDMAVVERRPLVGQYAKLGQPAVNDLMYARVVRELGSLGEFVELSLPQNGAAAELLPVDSLAGVPVTALTTGETVGAFNRVATMYVQPVVRRDRRHVALAVWRMRTNSTYTRFTSVAFDTLIDLPAVRDIERAVSTINFLDGAFYVATKFGAYRLSEANALERLTPTSAEIRDVFRHRGDFYATQSSAGPMFTSPDGRTWSSSGIATNLRLVHVFDDALLASQELEGWAWQLTGDIMAQSKPLALNEGFRPDDNSLYYGLVEFERHFYISVDNRIYRADSLAQRR